MTELKKSFSATIFIDYKPAELKQNKEWIIVYYAKVPAKDEFKRFRKRVPVIKNKTERLRYAKKMVVAINKKLESGWSPFYEEKGFQYKTFEDCANYYLKIQEKEVKDGIKRKVSLDAYKSYLKKITDFMKIKNYTIKYMVECDNTFVHSFLDYLYIEKGLSPRTYNNYLQFLSSFFIWCQSKGYIKQNPSALIKSKKPQKKKREVLGVYEKNELKEYGVENKAYYTLCMFTYYCFVRRTELTKLKVSDIDLKNMCITITGDKSKNKKTDIVTIPNALLPLLMNHLKNAKKDYYFFSKDNFEAGKNQLTPKKVSDEWSKFRKKHKIESKIQWYSLKDTGITDLLNSGIPSIKVRNQARHHDLKMTEIYTTRNNTSDEIVKNANFTF